MPSSQADLPDPPGRLEGLLAPNPDFEFPGATKPSLLSREIFKRLAQPAAVSAAELEAVEGTSLQIANAISKGRRVTNGWAVVHLVRHMDILWGGQFFALDALTDGLVQETARRGCQNPWPGPSSYAEYPTYSACVRALGQAIDKAMDQRGFTVTIVLGWLLIPAAQGLLAPSLEPPKEIMPSPSSAGSPSPARPAPFHPQRTMWGSREGLMAPSPANHGATKPLTSLVMPPAPARLTTTPTGLSSAPSPPTTTGGGGLRRNTAPP
jgi:hypothetical protein